MALTTATLIETYMGNQWDAGLVPLVNQLVADIPVEFERYCERTFDATNYRSWLDGTGDEYLRLDQYPVIRLNRVSFDLVNGIKVQVTGTNMTHASVSIDADTLDLYTITSGVTTSTAITKSSYATLTLLATQIETITGWTAEVQSGYEQYPSADLFPVLGRPCLSPDFEMLRIAGRVEDNIRVEDDTVGALLCYTGFPRGTRNVFADYRAGYETIPVDLQALVTRIAIETINLLSKDDSVASEKIGDYTVENRQMKDIITSAIELHKNEVIPWMRNP